MSLQSSRRRVIIRNERISMMTYDSLFILCANTQPVNDSLSQLALSLNWWWLGSIISNVGISKVDTSPQSIVHLKHIAKQGQQNEFQAQAILFKDAKVERITFELRRLKTSRFDAKTERMNAEQRQLLEETLAADQADH